jgi:hypothetical protein
MFREILSTEHSSYFKLRGILSLEEKASEEWSLADQGYVSRVSLPDLTWNFRN